jgi:hypothetical protein
VSGLAALEKETIPIINIAAATQIRRAIANAFDFRMNCFPLRSSSFCRPLGRKNEPGIAWHRGSDTNRDRVNRYKWNGPHTLPYDGKHRIKRFFFQQVS